MQLKWVIDLLGHQRLEFCLSIYPIMKSMTGLTGHFTKRPGYTLQSVSLYPNNICWIPAGNLFACDALEIHYKGLAWWRSYFQIIWDDKFVRDSDPIVRDWSIHPNKFWDQNYILIGSGTASRRGDSWPTEYIKRSNRLIVMTLRKISLFSILTTYPSSITLKLSQHIKRLQRCCLTGSRKINRLCLCV